MPDQPIRVPAGLTTEGLLRRRYMARLIDSVILGFLIAIAFGLRTALVPGLIGNPLNIFLNLFLVLIIWIGRPSAWRRSKPRHAISSGTPLFLCSACFRAADSCH